MLNLKTICIGKLKEKFYIEAAGEYSKRLSAFCRLEIEEISEQKLPDKPSDADILSALEKEKVSVEQKIPKGACLIALCVEGDMLDSVALSEYLQKISVGGYSKVCFVIGGSFGLHESIKKRADLRLSMSRMTFPHHLARVMLLEQIYRGFSIAEGTKYHK